MRQGRKRPRRYFERTRGAHDAAWLRRAEAEAYFEEKRRMADAAWRMQKMMDAKPQQWQIEMEAEKQLQAKGEGRTRGQEEAGPRPPQPPRPEREEAAGARRVLLPWGAPKPMKAAPAPTQHDVTFHSDDITASPQTLTSSEYPPPSPLPRTSWMGCPLLPG